MLIKPKKRIKKCPFKIGDRVKFTPNQRAIGWYQHSFERMKIHPGYEGTITAIKEETFIYLDKKIGGFPWTNFKKIQ